MHHGERSSALCVHPNPHFRGRRHRFLCGLEALRFTYQGRSTSCPEGALDSRDFTSLWLLWECCWLLRVSCRLVYLSLSP